MEEDREADQVPLSWHLIRRIFDYTQPHARKRNALFCLITIRGIMVPTIAWGIGAIINGKPIAGKDEHAAFSFMRLRF